jgi:hypothetical protein
VGMEDSYKDVNDNWLVDFVMSTDKITKLWKIFNFSNYFL